MLIWKCLRTCCGGLSQRWVVSTVVLSCLAIQYIHRLSFNLAITDITYPVTGADYNSEDEDVFEGACPYNKSEGVAPSHNHQEFDWDTSDQAWLVGSFYIGYIVTHLPGGLLADRYGPKRVMRWGVVVSALCSLLTPSVARLHTYALVALRSVMGLAQGPMFPAQSVFVARWALPHERNTINSYMNVGVVLGAVLANTCTGLMLDHMAQWDTVFFVYTALTAVWLVFWEVFAHDTAGQHPFITPEERERLEVALSGEVHEEPFFVDCCAVTRSAPVWAMIVGGLGHDWAFYIVLSLLPQYMGYVLMLNMTENGLASSLPYVVMLVFQLVSAKGATFLITRKVMTKTQQCKLFFFVTNQGPVVCFLAASYAGCSRLLVISLFALAMGFIGFSYSCIRVVNVDMAPNHAGFLMAIMNGLGSICGVLGPQLFSVFTQVHTVQNWRNAFFFSAALITLTTIVFTIWGSSEAQWWNFPPDPPPESPEADNSSPGTQKQD